jgi:hypothetical protein
MQAEMTQIITDQILVSHPTLGGTHLRGTSQRLTSKHHITNTNEGEILKVLAEKQAGE